MSEFRTDGGTGKILALLAPCAALVGLDSLVTVPPDPGHPPHHGRSGCF